MLPFQSLKMVDKAEGYRVEKENMFDLPMRVLIIGKSQLSGKTNLLGNLILRPYGNSDILGKECYAKDFEGRNIYIVCPSTNLDTKWNNIIKGKGIPEGNIYRTFDEESMNNLYKILENDFMEAKDSGRKPEHKLVLMDDISFSGDLKSKQHGALSLLFCNGRHLLISTVVLAQKYSDILTTARENATGCMLFASSQKQSELIYMDHGTCDKRTFIRAYNKATREPHSYLVINYSNLPDKRFMDSHFTPIPELCQLPIT